MSNVNITTETRRVVRAVINQEVLYPSVIIEVAEIDDDLYEVEIKNGYEKSNFVVTNQEVTTIAEMVKKLRVGDE
jgi:hypothetical protein